MLQFKNVGEQDDRHVVLAEFSKLPLAIRSLSNGSDLAVTFATGSVATMAINWVKTATKAWGDSRPVLVGALDAAMLAACEEHNAPCIPIDGGDVSKELEVGGAGSNLRSRPKLYPKMSVLKVGFYGQLLSWGYNVWACDADAVFAGDPRSLLGAEPWSDADIAVATDCIDVPADSRSPLLHCDFNTGMVFLRSRPAVIAFTERWRETIASAKETRIRDQAAFNMLTKAGPLVRRFNSRRLYDSTVGELTLSIGVLPLSQFLNGHTFFVQRAHTLPGAPPPLAVHMTYQFAEGDTFAYGKRQRLRQAGLWLVDEPGYYAGRYLSVSASGATLPHVAMDVNVDSRVAVKQHLSEHAHRIELLRAMLGIAKALGRELILPPMLCYCDFMWKEMRNCRVGGAESMRLPFECPMDHVLNTPAWFSKGVPGGAPGASLETTSIGVAIREPNFLQSPKLPKSVSSNVTKVSLPGFGALSAKQIIAALAPFVSAPVIELSDAFHRFCGFSEDKTEHDAFLVETAQLLTYRRTPFCMMEGSNNAPLFSQCCSPRKPGDKFFPCVNGFDPPAPLPQCAQ